LKLLLDEMYPSLSIREIDDRRETVRVSGVPDAAGRPRP